MTQVETHAAPEIKKIENRTHVSFTLPAGYDGKPTGAHSELEEYSLGFGRKGPSIEYSSSEDDQPDVRPANHPKKT